MTFEEIMQNLIEETERQNVLDAAGREVLKTQSIIDAIHPYTAILSASGSSLFQEAQKESMKDVNKWAKKAESVFSTSVDTKKFLSDTAKGLMRAEDLDKMIDDVASDWLWGPIISIVIAAVHVGTTMYNFLTVSSEKTRQIANEQIRPYLLDLATLTEESFRNPASVDWVTKEMAKMGITEEKIGIFMKNQTQLFPVDLLKLLYNRGEINEGELDKRLQHLRYKKDDLKMVKTGLKVFPTTPDLVLFSVREVFDPFFVQQAGLLQDMPAQFIEEMKMTGIEEKYTNMYWASHWVPPSRGDANQMLHRDVIDENEHNTLLRIQDVMPNYRDKLRQISFRPIGRVDIRRFYQDGVIGFDEMITRYKHAGFNADDAELMAVWTDVHYGEDRRSRTRADIIKLFKLGTYKREQAKDALQDIGYGEDVAEEYLLRVDLDREEKRKTNKLKIWKKGYIHNIYSESEVRGFMVALPLDKKEINDLIDEWLVERDIAQTFFSATQIEKLFRANLIGTINVKERLAIIGYTEDDAKLLISLWGQIDETETE